MFPGLGTYISDSGTKYQPKNNITANTLVLDPESLCLQGADGDCKSGDEVQEDDGRVCITESFDGIPDLEIMLVKLPCVVAEASSLPWMRIDSYLV